MNIQKFLLEAFEMDCGFGKIEFVAHNLGKRAI